MVAPGNRLKPVTRKAWAHELEVSRGTVQHSRGIGQVVDRTLKASSACALNCAAESRFLLIIERIIGLVGTSKVGHEAQDLDLRGIAKQREDLVPIRLVDAGAMQARLHLDVHLRGDFRLH